MADGYGNVYIFNLYVEEITKFNLNDQGSAGSIIAPSQNTKPLYVPQQIAVSRTALPLNNLNSPLFVQGKNVFTADYLGQNWSGVANIDPTIFPALNFDLWLYVAFQTAWLLDTFGHLQVIYAQQTMMMKDGKEVITVNYKPPGPLNINLDFK